MIETMNRFPKGQSLLNLTMVVSLFLLIGSLQRANASHHKKKRPEAKVWIESWKQVGVLPFGMSDFGVVVNKDYVYIIGGTDNYNFLDNVVMAKISPDGDIGDWKIQPSLNIKRSFFGAITHNGYIYVVGGESGNTDNELLNVVERAKIGKNGALGRWVVEKNSSNYSARCVKVVAHNGYLYSIGGWKGSVMDTIERARVREDGSLEEWVIDFEKMGKGRYIHSVFMDNGNLFVVAGHDVTKGTGTFRVEYSKIRNDASLSKWQESKPLPYNLFGQQLVKVDNTIYLIGGREGRELSNSVYMGTVNNAGTAIEEWSETAKLEYPVEHAGVFQYKNRIYVLGGMNKKGARKEIYIANIDSDNSLGSRISNREYDALQTFYDGVDNFMENRLNKAETLFIQAIDMNSNFWDAYFNLGWLYLQMDKPKKTIEQMQRLIEKNPTYEEAYLLMALGYDKERDTDKTLYFLRLAIENGFGDFLYLKNSPDLKNSRKDKKFEELLLEKIEGRFMF